jgi:hypothetical protein
MSLPLHGTAIGVALAILSVTAFAVDSARGGLTSMQTLSTLPKGHTVAEGQSTADVQVHPSGKFLYGPTAATTASWCLPSIRSPAG